MRLKRILIALLAALCLTALAACSGDKNDEQKLMEQGFTAKVTFDACGGDMNGRDERYVLVKPGSPVAAPGTAKLPAVYREDYTLEGWFVGQKTDDTVTYGEQWDFSADRVQESMTLYARWTRNYTYKVVVNGEVAMTRKTEPGGTFDAEAAERELRWDGHTFLDFYADESCKTAWNGATTHPGGDSYDMYVYTDWLDGVYVKARTADDFKQLSASTNYYLIGEDGVIDFTGFTDWQNPGQYTGKIIGNNVTLKNLTVTVENSRLQSQGLFGELLGAEIRDVRFENCSAEFIYSKDQKYPAIIYAAFLAGKAEQSTVENVAFDNCTVTVTATLDELVFASSLSGVFAEDESWLTVWPAGTVAMQGYGV